MMRWWWRSISKRPRECPWWHLQDRCLGGTAITIYWHLNTSQVDCVRARNPLCAWRQADWNKEWCSKSFWVPTKTKTCYHYHICPSWGLKSNHGNKVMGLLGDQLEWKLSFCMIHKGDMPQMTDLGNLANLACPF